MSGVGSREISRTQVPYHKRERKAHENATCVLCT